ncbi:MAG: YdcF family protein [Rhodospirillales bacterium]
MAPTRSHSRRRRSRRYFLWSAALAAAGMIVLWTGGLVWFASKLPHGVQDLDSRTDAIAVLTGGQGRLDAGFRLLSEERAQKLFVSGVYRGVDVNQLLELSQQNPADLKCCLEIGHSADNTAGNAEETAEWVRRNRFRSLRIVTSAYHMPRTMLEFRHAMPHIALVSHPVFTDNVKHERWWAWPGTSSLIVGEYNKYLLAWARHKSEALTTIFPKR